MNDNELLNIELNEYEEQLLMISDLEQEFNYKAEEVLADLNLLEEEKKKISDPDSLGKVMADEIWKQFGEQIGLNATKDTLRSNAEKKHAGEKYSDVGKKVMQDSRYKEANKAMREKQKAGKLTDEYTGKKIGRNDKANLDHVVSRKEIDDNIKRQMAGVPTKDLANMEQNLKPTNEALNKSKGSKSVNEFLEGRDNREDNLKKQNERANKKIDESNMSDAEKKAAKAKNDKNLQDKLNADDEKMKAADKEARKAINKKINKELRKETAKKAGKDALKQMSIAALSSLLKKIMGAFVDFIKEKEKSLKNFFAHMKDAIISFFKEIGNIIKTGVSSIIGTIVTTIFEPIKKIFTKLVSFIKMGAKSVIDAIKYLTDKENKDKPFGIKMAEMSKILVTGVVGASAILLGEAFGEALKSIPGLGIEIPLFGSLAEIIGVFFASVVSGLIGAMLINRIDKFFADKQKSEITIKQNKKSNELQNIQEKQQIIAESKLKIGKEKTYKSVATRHMTVAEMMKESFQKIDNTINESAPYEDSIDYEDLLVKDELNTVGDDLDDLLADL